MRVKKRITMVTRMEMTYLARTLMILGLFRLFDALGRSKCPVVASRLSIAFPSQHHFGFYIRNHYCMYSKTQIVFHNDYKLPPLYASRKRSDVLNDNDVIRKSCYIMQNIFAKYCRTVSSSISVVALSLALLTMMVPSLPSFAATAPSFSSSSSFPSPSSLLCSANAEVLVDAAAADRFRAALRTLQTLDDQWDALVRGQGDNVRRQLGGPSSNPTIIDPLLTHNQPTHYRPAIGDDLTCRVPSLCVWCMWRCRHGVYAAQVRESAVQLLVLRHAVRAESP